MHPYGFRKTEYANPGAENYAFIPNMTLPALSPGGAGSDIVGVMRVLQHPQLVTQVTVPTDGYGGLSAGQFVSQPLQE